MNKTFHKKNFQKKYNIPLEVIKGEQSISIDIAKKLSSIIGTSIDYWINLQKEYDKLINNGIRFLSK